MNHETTHTRKARKLTLGQLRMRQTIGLGLALILIGVLLGLAPLPQANASKGKTLGNSKMPAKLEFFVGKRKVVVQIVTPAERAAMDTAKAQLSGGNSERAMAEEIHRLTNRSLAGLKVTQFADGTEALDLNDNFQFVPVAKKNEDGTTEIFCSESLQEASRFLNLDKTIVNEVAKSKLDAATPKAPIKLNRLSGPAAPTKPQVDQTTLTIVNINAANVGFNDPAPVAPVGGNMGTTLGEQRLIAFQHAASIWAATLDSNVEIVVRARFSALTCTATSAVLGSAGAITIFRNYPANGSFPGAELPDTWYNSSLANKRSGLDLAPGAPNTSADDLNANFNINLGQPNCLAGSPFYLGLDANHGTGVDLVAVLLHEFAHGLGFQQFASVTSGVLQGGFPDVYNRKLLDLTTGKTWDQMINAERMASAINTRKLAFIGNRVTADVPTALNLGFPLLTVASPANIAGIYQVGTAGFGPVLTAPGLTGTLVLGLDPADAAGPTTTDACSPLTNAADVAGKIAVVDRGTCGFTIKVKNAQDAGAIAVLVADNAAGSPPAGLGGADPTITIPSARITLPDGNTIKAELANTVTATLGVNPSVRAGTSADGKALVYTPNPVASGSTVSHWDTSAFPNQLMEPSINGDLTHSVKLPEDLTLSLMRDIGWFPDSNLNGVADGSASTTTLASSANPSITGQSVTFTATVAAVAPIVGVPTGTVQFKVDGVNAGGPVALVNGQASFTSSALAQGVRSITANYSGSVDFLASSAALQQSVNRMGLAIADPAVCLGPGGVVGVTATVTNSGAAPVAIAFTAVLPVQLLALPGTCTSNVAGISCDAANASTVTATGTLAVGQTVTLNYLGQVADNTPTGTQLCINSTVAFAGNPATANVQACTNVTCPPVGPGVPYAANSEVSGQKPGSVLVYNLYTSNAAAPNTQNTRISMTNTHLNQIIAVHLFFVDGGTCSVADVFLCLTPNQTASFLVSDFDPGTTGYVIAVASDPRTGCPINFNYLIGDEFVKLSSGHEANLAAESVAAVAGGLTFCNPNSTTAQLNFDGVSYNRLPRVLALSNLPSRADGNETLVVINRIGGNLSSSASTLGTLFGVLYDDSENPFSFSLAGGCQIRGVFGSTSFPRTTPPISQIIPAGRSGWFRIYSQSDIAILGAAINLNTNAAAVANAFNQGHNLHKLNLSAAANITIPIFPPPCN
jgi:hypothetical protein